MIIIKRFDSYTINNKCLLYHILFLFLHNSPIHRRYSRDVSVSTNCLLRLRFIYLSQFLLIFCNYRIFGSLLQSSLVSGPKYFHVHSFKKLYSFRFRFRPILELTVIYAVCMYTLFLFLQAGRKIRWNSIQFSMRARTLGHGEVQIFFLCLLKV